MGDRKKSAPILSAEKISEFVHGLDHPEGIAWGMDGFIYAGSEAGEVYRIDPDNPVAKAFASTGGFLLGLALDGAHNVYACDSKHAVVHYITPAGRVTTYCAGAPREPFMLPNYPVFDNRGYLFVSDSGHWHEDNGKIFRISPGGNAEVWCRDLCEFPNGLCLDADETFLYVAMSVNPPRVSRVEILRDGRAGVSETIIEMPGTVPDGLAFDKDKNLYISCYRPDAIYRLTPRGELQVVAEDYEGTRIAAPTNIAFCGRDREILLSSNIGRWHLTRYELGIPGMPLNYPRLQSH